MTLRGFPVERHRWSERLGHQLLPSQVHVSASLSFTIGNHCKGDVWYFVKCLSRPKYTCTYIQVYKVPLQEVARGVAQERNEKQPAWYEYHYAGNRRIKIVFGYEQIKYINKQTDLAFPDRAVPFFCLYLETNSLELRNIGYFVQYYIVEAGS